MSFADLAKTIDAAWEDRASISPAIWKVEAILASGSFHESLSPIFLIALVSVAIAASERSWKSARFAATIPVSTLGTLMAASLGFNVVAFEPMTAPVNALVTALVFRRELSALPRSGGGSAAPPEVLAFAATRQAGSPRVTARHCPALL